ncbi:hypothetical protein ASPACDRAFT_63268 [Aspergillus aculeatus ATCC 16872]|uniref:Uncharacterized protein n=1 Tax=Aspergillus aculeatus (strain ATCC 16872 / CBS 172.66 / WB 5094) TaxID=690307 RepID=A0A1L9WLC7_ASPA1|nr:uncharacterized protein ASPACDRAFT_63268 [Aspergillus aculeatus ATCC 16872]OJJ96956.1 hypothetical protein ASPACDRAFT_63268 [Aspergillus aculeatus ATCC 16872]
MDADVDVKPSHIPPSPQNDLETIINLHQKTTYDTHTTDSPLKPNNKPSHNNGLPSPPSGSNASLADELPDYSTSPTAWLAAVAGKVYPASDRYHGWDIQITTEAAAPASSSEEDHHNTSPCDVITISHSVSGTVLILVRGQIIFGEYPGSSSPSWVNTTDDDAPLEPWRLSENEGRAWFADKLLEIRWSAGEPRYVVSYWVWTKLGLSYADFLNLGKYDPLAFE